VFGDDPDGERGVGGARPGNGGGGFLGHSGCSGGGCGQPYGFGIWG
jgi:hypothetical protein